MQVNTIRVKDFFSAAPVLMLTAAFMAIDLLFCVIGLLFDHTVITGMPAWVKPTKFAISTGIYALSLVVIIQYTRIWKRTLRVAELLTGAALIIEIVLIDMQAARHTTSHFNVSTPFDQNVFAIMGVAIGILWLCSIVLAAATLRTRYGSPMWTMAVRYGMLLAVLGAGTGGFMAPPSHAQIATARITHHMPISGSHSVGGPDGGKGLPVLGWSTQYGDIRVAHFTGLHAPQLLALLALLLQRRRVTQRAATRIMSAAVMSYGSFFLIALAEALWKEPITDHGPLFLTVWTLWAVLSVSLFLGAGATNIQRVGEEAMA